jgi:hypothetical protein
MDVSVVINQFITFLNNSYDGIAKLVQYIDNERNDIILADKIENGYYQFIWEIIVEAQLCTEGDYLDPYGDGADFYGKSSRVVYPEKAANTKIIVNVKNNLDYFSQRKTTSENLDLLKFVSYDGSHYFITKPFDFVLCEDYLGNQFLFKLNEVGFSLEKI